jgi:hypothetical protein
LGAKDQEQLEQKYDEYRGAMSVLQSQWFKFDEDTRQACLELVPEEKEEGEEDEDAGDREDASGSKQ